MVAGRPVYGKTIVLEPNKLWFVREFRAPVLSDAMTFQHAFQEARKLSSTNVLGLAEIVTLHQGALFVVATFLRGKMRYQGKRANEASKMNLPPTG